jgi:hypothetical protein
MWKTRVLYQLHFYSESGRLQSAREISCVDDAAARTLAQTEAVGSNKIVVAWTGARMVARFYPGESTMPARFTLARNHRT